MAVERILLNADHEEEKKKLQNKILTLTELKTNEIERYKDFDNLIQTYRNLPLK